MADRRRQDDQDRRHAAGDIGARLSNRRFAVAARKKARVKRGSAFRFTLTEKATVKFTIERKTSGRKSGKKCKAKTKKNKSKKKCTLFKSAGSLSAAGKAGKNTMPLLRQGQGQEAEARQLPRDGGRDRLGQGQVGGEDGQLHGRPRLSRTAAPLRDPVNLEQVGSEPLVGQSGRDADQVARLGEAEFARALGAALE